MPDASFLAALAFVLAALCGLPSLLDALRKR